MGILKVRDKHGEYGKYRTESNVPLNNIVTIAMSKLWFIQHNATN